MPPVELHFPPRSVVATAHCEGSARITSRQGRACLSLGSRYEIWDEASCQPLQGTASIDLELDAVILTRCVRDAILEAIHAATARTIRDSDLYLDAPWA